MQAYIIKQTYDNTYFISNIILTDLHYHFINSLDSYKSHNSMISTSSIGLNNEDLQAISIPIVITDSNSIHYESGSV